MTTKLFLKFIKKEKTHFFAVKLLQRQFSTKCDKLEINIDEINANLFKDSKEKKIIDFEMLSVDDPLEPLEGNSNIKFKMNLFYGINKAYCFLSKKKGQLIEYNFIDHQDIYYGKIKLDEFDGNDFVKRLVLINAPTKIMINNELIYLPSLVSKLIVKGENSFEICDCNYENKSFAIKIIKNEEIIDWYSKINLQKDQLVKFYGEFTNLVKNQVKNKDTFKELYKRYSIKPYEVFFSRSKSELNKQFKTEDDFQLIHLYLLWHFIDSAVRSQNIEIPIKDLYDEIEYLYQLYLKEKDLYLYEKAMLFYSHVSFFFEKNNIAKYKSSNLKFIIKRRDIKDNSIYGLSFSFLKNFINGLKAESYLFFPLLMLDSGIYYNNDDMNDKHNNIYGYNRESCDIIKSHLEELIPELFFEYDDEENDVYKEHGINFKGYHVIFLNRKIILKNFNKDPSNYAYQNGVEEKLFKHYSVRVSKTMMHESFARDKIIFNKSNAIKSPLKFYNRQKILVEMVPNISFVSNLDNRIEYFKVPKDSKGESGKFFEYFFGIFNGRLIIDLIYEIDNLEKLYDNVKIFLSENLDELQKYIINKYKIKYYKLDYKEKNIPFNEENELMNSIVQNHEKNLTPTKKLGNKVEKENIEDNINSKKNIVFYEKIEDEYTEYKDLDYYRKKLFEEEQDYEEKNEYLSLYLKNLHTS